jgi:hypothetical protein
MALANTQAYANQIDPEFNKIFFDEYLEKPPEYTMDSKIIDAPQGNRYSEGVLSGLGALVSMPEGGLISYDVPEEGKTKTINWNKFGLGFQLTKEMFEDDLHGHMRAMPRKLAKSANFTVETENADIFNSGFTTELANDGLSVFNNAHTLLKSAATFDNNAGATSLSETSLEAALEYFEDLVDEQNFPVDMTARLLIVPTALRGTAKVILGTAHIPTSANNDISQVFDEGLGWMVNHYLTSTTAWFVVGTNADKRMYWKNRVEFISADDFPTGNALFKAVTRFTPTVYDPRGLYGATG